MWDWSIYENRSAISEGRRRSLCSCIVAVLLGGLILLMVTTVRPRIGGYFALMVGGMIIFLMGIVGLVIICVYYPMGCCKGERRASTIGIQEGSINNVPVTPGRDKPPSPAPQYDDPPSYEAAILNNGVV